MRSWLFKSPVPKFLDEDFEYIKLNRCELDIIWTLGSEGPKSYYSLQKRSYFLPTNLKAEVGEVLSKEQINRSVRYDYDYIYRTVNELEKRGFVKTSKDTSRTRTRVMAELTMMGLMLYLTGSNNKERFKHVDKYYKKYLSAEQLEQLRKKLEDENETH